MTAFNNANLFITDYNFGFDGTRWNERVKFIASSKSAVLGLWSDIWWGSSAEATGDGTPATPPAVARQIGEFLIPWPSGKAYVSA